MKKKHIPILLATALALIALFVSQSLWFRYASVKDTQEQAISFTSCFNESISSLIRSRMDTENNYPYTIEPIDSISLEKIMKEQKPSIINAGDIKEDCNVAVMIENALIVLKIEEGKFDLKELNIMLTTLLNEKGKVVSSHITLHDTRSNKIVDEVKQEIPHANDSFFIKTYTAERIIEIPDGNYIIRAEYRIEQPNYLQRLGVVTLVSFVASIVIISVLFYLLLMLKRGYNELVNMERSFHGAVHDLKSPLAFVFFQLSLMEEDETNGQKKASLSLTADRVNFLTDKIMRLLKSAQSIVKIDDAQKCEVVLYDMLEQIESEMRTMFPEKKICFTYNIDPDFTMYVHPDLMEASIRIIIENAVKYNSNETEVEVTAMQNLDKLDIYISDNGIGMTKRQMKNIFKPYFTTDTVQGNGIGLYYAQSIVKAHNGIISAKSEAGKGSEFVITLPNISA